MKKILLFKQIICCFFFIFTFTISLYGQKKESITVPDDVLQTFEFEQPNAKKPVWSLEKGIYVVHFKSEGAAAITYIKNDGNLVKTIYEIPRASLPSAITDYIVNNYPTGKISRQELWEEPNVKIYYYIEVKPEDITQDPSNLTFSDVGKLLTKKDPVGFVAQEAKSPAAAGGNATTQQKNTTTTKTQAVANSTRVKKQSAAPAMANDQVAENEVPAAVKKALTKKVVRPTGVKWFKKGDTYRAELIARELPNKIFISSAGIWEKSLIEIDKSMVIGNLERHIDRYYKGAKVIKGTKEFRADKKDMIWVDVIEKKNAKAKLITTLQFDKFSKFIREIPREGEEVDQEYIPDAVKRAFEKKYPKVQGVVYSEDDEGYFLGMFFGMKGKEFLVMEGNGMIIETRVEGNMSNINPNIKGFVKSKIKGGKITEYYVVRSIVEKRNFFRVVVTEKKTGMVHTLKFATNGKIIQ